ncbi:hypothetical protein [Erythrobacter mangrovi]|uniref:Uncharacterized protein n=1 Tax=Erythrobacter mangrovi TaxID=2739433 RepID=A0A7D4BAY2_9SPHN|nr:hypothetical protein [Erythrobacter mangrovi]QKG71841.1 hypothetical protein HQR01_10995 [Erythrobacter mangrovi]
MTKLILAGAAAIAFAVAPTFAQVAEQPGTTEPAETAPPANAPASTMAPRFVSKPVVQATGASDVPATGDLPICKPDQQDNCINGWEKNRTGNRPLEYWPGLPASEIEEPLPATRPDE